MKIEKGTKVLITAVAMGKSGCRLFLTDINEKGLGETCRLVSRSGGEVCLYRSFDISVFDDVRAFADAVHAESGALDILINNAGIALFALVENMTHAHWQKVINTNLWGPIHGIECFIKEMIRASFDIKALYFLKNIFSRPTIVF